MAADANSPAEHAYLLEMRDRSGFDAHGQGESDRGDITFDPGVLLAYTDEDHGYGNVGTDDPPAQTPLDSRPEPGSDTPNLDDAAFKAGDSFSDGGAGHTDNYSSGDGNWVLSYGCLSFNVSRLAGTGIGPEVAGAYDMNGDVAFTTTPQCGQFDYGTGAKSDGVPVQPPVDAADAGEQAGRAGRPSARPSVKSVTKAQRRARHAACASAARCARSARRARRSARRR